MPARLVHHYQHHQHYHPYKTTSRPHPQIKTKPTSPSKQQPKPSTRCFDWLLLPTNSNTHIAKNRSSFSDYRRAPCKIANQRVLGVGTVQLRVQRAPDDPRTNILVLHDVLHIPNARCNGISVAKYTGESDEGSEDGSEKQREGEGVDGLRVVLAGDKERGNEGLEESDERGRMLGVVASKEELEMLNERVRNRSWV
ncbi:hypothetical protein BO78DRAFT_371825 [Aspergillus sclerotiicarbonarius CBS 121057]|uniref:Retrovirus-related Pol polyprotein from transposon TNT 1-94-like beta-barrel domain-containing protein n=1 Tax=Aspergillus sclerotiicarbonarius (strain CBS 121057 / IBT 28362) TaxID=1448318 RepID=A0A319E4F7_ASPSB|nr:hypothetical protein BO78DRAFT_371825 [Aspergillus sclerotiicarbonarius CBS 121057]